MSQSLAKNYVHLVWSTKYRQPFIDEKIEEQLWAYMGGLCRSLECQPIKIGGWYDHVHLLCLLSRKIPMMDLLRVVKANSSGWMKEQGKEYYNFYWQDGYAAFSVSPPHVDIVVNYIADQKEHHFKQGYQDEVRAFLKRYKMQHDERYFWDLIFL